MLEKPNDPHPLAQLNLVEPPKADVHFFPQKSHFPTTFFCPKNVVYRIAPDQLFSHE